MVKSRQQKQLERRESILLAAERVFGAKGYAAATVDEVAAEAGISKGSMYNYFKSKQDLFTQVFLWSVVQDEARADELLQQDMPARDKLNMQLDNWWERFPHYKGVGRLVLEFWISGTSEEEGPFAEAFGGIYDRWQGRLVSIFTQGVAKGEFALRYEPEAAASLVMALLDGLLLHCLLGIGRELNDEYLAALKRSIFNALERDTDRPDSGQSIQEKS
ncbi:MAG: TetR/AcrR family transcriptional regulator [Phycisphaerae bacterium]|nr:TetR/AcrR family transcriptional regulator [Phycisphaerae bacterium]